MKRMGLWISRLKNIQQTNVKWDNIKTKYPHLFICNEQKWKHTFKMIQQYVDNYHILPWNSVKEHTIEIKKLYNWWNDQNKNYKNKTQIMQYDNIRKIWEEFKDQYHELFMSNEEIWYTSLNKLKEYAGTENPGGNVTITIQDDKIKGYNGVFLFPIIKMHATRKCEYGFCWSRTKTTTPERHYFLPFLVALLEFLFPKLSNSFASSAPPLDLRETTITVSSPAIVPIIDLIPE